MKTRSAYLRAPWQVELRTVELPDAPPAGYALIRIEACGVCGSDLANAAKLATDWKAFGHEIAGVIEAVADPGAPVQVGTKVVLESSTFCGHCALCRDGRTDLCAQAPNFWSQPAMGFADRMMAPLACLVPYAGLTPEVASLAEPAGVACERAASIAPWLANERIRIMLWTIAIVLMLLWLLGLITAHTFGGVLHVLLLVALIVVVIRLFQGRRLFT